MPVLSGCVVVVVVVHVTCSTPFISSHRVHFQALPGRLTELKDQRQKLSSEENHVAVVWPEIDIFRHFHHSHCVIRREEKRRDEKEKERREQFKSL